MAILGDGGAATSDLGRANAAHSLLRTRFTIIQWINHLGIVDESDVTLRSLLVSGRRRRIPGASEKRHFGLQRVTKQVEVGHR